jgi:hypothetical protein
VASDDWAASVRATYRDPNFAWDRNRWRLDDSLPQHLIDALDANGGTATIPTLATQGFSPNQLRYLTRDVDAPSGASMVTTSGRGPDRTYSLRTCPHCGEAATVVFRTPETATGPLCITCRKSPADHSPAFPDFYFPS